MSVLRDYATTVTQPTLPFAVPSRDGRDDMTRYDEVVAPDGGLRPAWKSMADLALALTPDELRRVEGEITRFLADDGVTYVRPDGGAQPWQLDPMPLVIDAPEWARLEIGLAQRAELLNAVLSDLYGPQTLLASGVVPSACVFGHSGFARPVARPGVVDTQPLLLSATDLGRDARGEWHVLTDRVQAPSGLGFAMENRRVIAQVLPDLYQGSDLHRMEPYFSALRAALLDSAPGVASPQVAVLSPGPHSETAFDQAFLANALGMPLVQGSDLVVRDGWVWMKPAGWPRTAPRERVDVIVRRVDAEWCDPLELRADSRLGVAGLAEAVRRGHVRLVNGLGAGVLENPGLMPFLPAACERLLGEQLRLPSVPTLWCGDPEARQQVLERLAADDPALIVRAIDEPRATLAAASPAELRARILAEPHRFVGQELLPLSQAPVWADRARAEAWPVVFRSFTLRYGSAYRPLVGGLATVLADADSGPVTKDVWVLKATQDDPDQGLIESAPPTISPTVPPLAPRALADMFWVGRYAERAEDLLRLLLTTHHQLEQLSRRPTSQAAESTDVLRGALRRLAGDAGPDADAELRALLLDATRTGGAAHALAHLRESLMGVRDQLSGDTWRVFSAIDRATRALRASPHAHRTAESAGRMLTAILSLQGVTASMMRDPGWHMIEAGRSLERALQLCHLLVATATRRRDYRADREVLEAMLTASESIVTYRRRYRGSVRTADALELLLLDGGNPRSLTFCLAALRGHLAAMPASTGSTRPERLLEHLETALDHVDVAVLTAPDGEHRPALTEFLVDVIAQLEQLADSVAHVHFESGPPPLPLSELALVEERAGA
ncbi:circularly permuted type 2 ATP-grasp protein [Microbacterium sp. zg.Y1084]|uniref:circularly permuted type 2 ATP-grasp protein n=1 Tax=Microbacterium sp. zg.Y1084 TaxID=2969667 RepID=UPI00214CB918|nr:circularly permuted type 2 ATP-grasp protein [Microbacterium sp. zg.Y1084]MCR2813889.1 circularly permuted type 2 ATP-grasp protein [Microbacterium sp. zg.Y1084]